MRRGGPVVVLVTGLASTAALAQDDRAFVEILESSGAVDGAGERADRLRVTLRIANRLPVPVEDVEVAVVLVTGVRRPDGGEAPVPGWRIERAFHDAPIAALAEADLYVDEPLAAQRQTPRASDISYRPSIRTYRLARPHLGLAVKLLESSAHSDQRAAIATFDTPPRADAAAFLERAGVAIRGRLRSPPTAPTPSDALELLLAIRSAGGIGGAELVGPLLTLPGRLDARVWGTAVDELAVRMRDGSGRDDPRLELLPVRAGTTPSAPRTEDAIVEAVRDAVVRIGEAAVPALLRAEHLLASRRAQQLAVGLLSVLGRSTVRSQLSVSSPSVRVQVIGVLGEIGSPAFVTELAEQVTSHDANVRRAATGALERIGAAAIDPLVDALGTPDRKRRAALVAVIEKIASNHRAAIRRAATRYGVPAPRSTPPHEIAHAIADRLAVAARARWTTELMHGLALGRQGRFDAAFRTLDAVYQADPELYMRHARDIALVYLRRARSLHERGNFDAAAETLRVGQSIAPLPEATALFERTQLGLAAGYLSLGALDRVEAALDACTRTSGDTAEVMRLRARLLGRRARVAADAKDRGRARRLLDRARAIRPDDPELLELDRRLLLRENAAIVAVLGLGAPAILLALALWFRRRVQAARLARLESVIDRAD